MKNKNNLLIAIFFLSTRTFSMIKQTKEFEVIRFSLINQFKQPFTSFLMPFVLPIIGNFLYRLKDKNHPLFWNKNYSYLIPISIAIPSIIRTIADVQKIKKVRKIEKIIGRNFLR